MKTAFKHFLRIILISVGIFAVVFGGQMIWYSFHFPKPPQDAPETLSPLFKTFLAPVDLLPEQLLQSATMAILIVSLYTLILGTVLYLLIYIVALESKRRSKHGNPEAS